LHVIPALWSLEINSRLAGGSQDPPLRRAESLLSVHREREQCVLVARARRHHDELLPRLRAVRHRVRRIVIRDLLAPDLLAGLRLEGIEVAVATADEDEAALGDHRATKVARRPEAFG